MNIPSTKDLMQTEEKLQTPEIRVWVHPGSGDDYFNVFKSFKDAEAFIKKNKHTEFVPLIAFRGYEFNLYDESVK
jgi:hypothetical protein